MPTPAPPLRTCTRYRTNGTSCTERTNRADGWCGTCDGFTTPQARETTTRSPFTSNDTALPPLDAEDAHSISVTRTAISAYLQHHGGTPAEAEAQIRSLLEDALLLSKYGRRNPAGRWTIGVDNFRYTLTITEDLAAVAAYSTVHAERTWAQVKSGVASRVAWHNRALTACDDLPIRVFPAALREYAKYHGHHPGQDADSMTRFLAAFRESLEARLAAMGNPNGDERIHIPDPATPDAGWSISPSNPKHERAAVFGYGPPRDPKPTDESNVAAPAATHLSADPA